MAFSLFRGGWGSYPGQEQSSGSWLRLSISGWVLRGWRGGDVQSMNLGHLHPGTSWRPFQKEFVPWKQESGQPQLGLTWEPCLVLFYLGVGACLFSLHSPAETPGSILSLPGKSWRRRMMTAKSSWRIRIAECGWKFHHEEEWRAVKRWRRGNSWIYNAQGVV